jgi:putative SOS response-associated peptidase YedK
MPVIMLSGCYHDWLNITSNTDDAYDLLENSAYANMVTTPVGDWVNNPRHDNIGCIEPKMK